MISDPKRLLRVFLCHATEDKPVVRELYERLKSEDWIDPWLDVMKLLPGQDWKLEIRRALASADSVIILISKKSTNKEGFVQREMNYAWDLSLEKPRNMIYLIPVRLEECNIPDDLTERQWANYFGEGKEDTYTTILQSLKLRYDQKLRFESQENVPTTYEKQGIPENHYLEGFVDKHQDVYRKTDIGKILEELIVRQSQEYINNGYSTDLLKRGLIKATEIVNEELCRVAVPIHTKEEIFSVVNTSIEDIEIADLIADTMDKVGKHGAIAIEESSSLQFETRFVEGIQFDQGYLSPYFITTNDKMKAVINEPYILISEKKISSALDIVPIMEKLLHTGKRDVVVIAEDIDGEALATLVLNKSRGMMNLLGIKAPGFGDHRKAILKDIAILTGGTVFSEGAGRKLEIATMQDLGRAEQVVSDKENTTIVGGKAKKDDVEDRIKEIRVEIDKTTNEFDKEKLQERLAKLRSGVAIIHVGAATETEMKEKKHRVEVALPVARAAVVEGIVPGNGVASLHAIEALDKQKTNLQYEKLGISIIRNVLDAPIRRIAVAAGLDGTTVLNNIIKTSKETQNLRIGYDMYTENYVDMVETGIIEPPSRFTTILKKAVDSAIVRMGNQGNA